MWEMARDAPGPSFLEHLRIVECHENGMGERFL